MGGHPRADVLERGLKGPFDAQGWHYRRSLASRVALLTTIVVGLSVAVAAAAAFITVRMAMQSALDESMLNRATEAAEGGALAEIQLQLPPWIYGAADVRIAVITANRELRSLDRGARHPQARRPRARRGARRPQSSRCAPSAPTQACATAWSPCRPAPTRP